jgi:hypothetical protein
MVQKVFLLYSKYDETNTQLKDLIQDIKQNQNFIFIQNNELDDETKKIILEYEIFICCLSKKFYDSKLIDTVKFAHFIARKRINTIYFEHEKERFLAKVEDQSFFRFKTVEYSSFDKILKVNFFLYIAQRI